MKGISFRKIKPTKTNLIALQKKLNFTIKGENFLEFKREQLINHIKEIWPEYQMYRLSFVNEFRKVMVNLYRTYKEMGEIDLKLTSELSKVQFKPQINIKYIKRIGIITPQITHKLTIGEKLPAYSFENTCYHLDELVNIHLKNMLDSLINLAEKEDNMLKFAINFKKLNRRINGLKNVIIPDLQSEIKKIREVLEEMERESFVRLKKTKDLIKKEQKII